MVGKKKIIWSLLLTIILVGLAGCNDRSVTTQKPIRVVSSIDFYGEVAQQVAGKYGQVSSVIHSSSVDPHDFEPTTSNAKSVANANVVIQNGAGYDTWMNKLVNASDQKIAHIQVSEDLLNKKDGSNEHVWYEPNTMPKLARKLANQFSKLDPSHAKYYQKNATKYVQSLAPINKLTNELKQNVDKNNELVDVSEPVFNYALTNLGYHVNNQHFAKSIEDGNDPSPADIGKMQADIKEHKIAFLVVNVQESDHVITNMVKLARKYNVPVLKVAESLPKGLNYKQWMIKQYQQLKQIQQGM
ncbi:metal ABC transporter solute-binding protein, Zn/Mn family [Paucilactobacillus kaifaensis]|uniref:metal ABC transporter solute-binding protein, Zn/Mn family n=1 Tax=Paucilactobacillus kaifaensis TaxID=2559921 RepID=UPI0010F66446|nr:zinc ABC transporter substrate-binding protein [Paucilactobacillus kaifaensis]